MSDAPKLHDGPTESARFDCGCLRSLGCQCHNPDAPRGPLRSGPDREYLLAQLVKADEGLREAQADATREWRRANRLSYAMRTWRAVALAALVTLAAVLAAGLLSLI